MKSLLLDTCAFIYFIQGNSKLSDTAKEAIENSDNIRYISIASVWEMAIKQSIGKLTLYSETIDFENFISNQLLTNDIQLLSIELVHTAKIIEMEKHHNDPFDRLILAQGMVNGFEIITDDGNFPSYPVTLLW